MELKQEARYKELAEETSPSLALFYCCIAFDVPLDLECVPRDGSADQWLAYIDELRIKGRDLGDGGKKLGFLDGLTDITKIFGNNLEKGEFSTAIDLEKSARNRKPGTQRQRKAWGDGKDEDGNGGYTTADYNRLDELFNTYSSRLEKPDTQQEYILRLCSRMTLDMEKLLSAGDVGNAQKLNKMIQENLASENLRRKDAKPVEDFKLDLWADALEKAGLMKNGKRCPPDEMFRILFCRPTKYKYSADAAEQILTICVNRARVNDGMGELSTIEPDMRIIDELGEFTEEQSERELEVYSKLGIVKMPPPGHEKDDIAGDT